MQTTLSPWSCWNGFNIVVIFYVQLQTPSHHWSPVIVDIPISNITNQIQITKQRLFASSMHNFNQGSYKSQRPSLRCQLLSTLISACVHRVVPYLSQYLSPRDLSGCSVFTKFPFFCGIWFMFSPSILQRCRRQLYLIRCN